MTLKGKIIAFLLVFQILLLLNCMGVYGATNQDDLWAKAVQVASQNGDFIPGNIHIEAKVIRNTGKIDNTGESWIRLTENEKGEVKDETIKQLGNGKDITGQPQNNKHRKQFNYNLDLTDLTLPFRPQAQSEITVTRTSSSEIKDDQQCTVYDFQCSNPKGERMIGKAWLNGNGIPLALRYTFNPLPKGLPKQLRNLTHEVHYQYQRNGTWYPDKVHIEGKLKSWFSSIICHWDYTFNDYWQYKKPLVATILTGGNPVIDQVAKWVIPFDYVDEHLFVKVKLNEEGDEHRFLFDTGAAYTLLNPRIVSDLNLKKVGSIEVSDGYSSQNSDVVVLKNLRLGEVRVDNCGAVISTFDNLESHGLKVDGILGSNFLRFFTVRIDYDKQTLTFTSNCNNYAEEMAASKKVPLFQGDSGLIFASFGILDSSKTFLAEIDTGANGNITIPSQYLNDFRVVLNSKIVQSEGSTTGGMFGRSTETLARCAEFTIGDMKIKDLPVYFNNRKLDFIMVGNDFWSHFVMIIDYPHSEMYLLPLKDKVMDTNVNTYGFGIELGKKGQIQVMGTWKGSAADRSGLKPGDIILWMTADEETGVSYDECMKILKNDSHQTIHVFVQCGLGEKEIVITKSLLLPEVK